jgi:hypothetical protein
MSDKSEKLATLQSTIRVAVESRLLDLHTALPGIIEEFNPVTQTASVQPTVKRVFKIQDQDTEELVPENLPLCINVPVACLRGGGFSITLPVKPGDECLLIFCERAFDSWFQTGEIRQPNAKRKHSLSDAIAIVGISSLPNSIPDYDPDNLEIKKDDNSVSIKLTATGLEITTSGDIDVTAGGDANITANNVNIDASVTNLGVGGEPIARVGDEVQVIITSGSSAGTWDGTITSGGDNTSI